ncbi:MAG: winged helix DNA-binding domain-containing protein [Acidimicrobiales bacterium]
MRRFDLAERRRRLARRHRLGPWAAPSVEEATASMVALHATDPATVYLSSLARTADASLAAMDRALHDDRSLVRVLAMRRTLFVVPTPHLATVEASSSVTVAANERRRLVGYLADGGVDDPAAWLAGAAVEVEAALLEAGERGLSAREITARVPRLAARMTIGAGSRNEVTTGATSRVLGVLAAEGRLLRGRTAGGWTTRRYQWHLRHQWLGPDAPPAPAADAGEAVARAASAELVERWLRAFGPAPFDDLKWWTGWTVRQLKAALAGLDVAEVALESGTVGLALVDDLEPVGDPAGDGDDQPWVALLPALDPTPMGWKERGWYLGQHREPLFDRSGNIGPTVWADGRIVGGWGQRPGGEIAVELLEDVGADHRALIEGEVERLYRLVGPTPVRPAFPTPLQKKLSG